MARLIFRRFALLGLFVLFVAGNVAAMEPAIMLATSRESTIALSGSTTRVMLTKSPDISVPLDKFGAAGRRIYLVIDGLAANLPPGVTYSVFLGLPEGTKPSRDDPGYVGTLNFFDVPSSPRSGDSRSVAFDVTAALARLRAAGRSIDLLQVAITPDMAPYVEAKPILGSLKLVAE
jgi:hypothetical protein